MKKLSCLLLFLLGINCCAQSTDQKAQEIYRQAFNLRFPASEQLIEDLAGQKHPLVSLTRSFMQGFRVFVEEDKKIFEEYKKLKPSLIEEIEAFSGNSPYKLYALAEINLHYSLARVKFGEYLTAAYELKKCQSYLRQNMKLFPAFAPNKKLRAILNCVFGSIPDDYKWILSIVGFEGDVNRGLSEIREYNSVVRKSQQYHFLKEDGQVWDLTLRNHFSNEPIGPVELSDLGSESPLVTFAVSSALIKQGRNNQAISVIRNRKKGIEIYEIPYFNYQLGVCYANKLETEQSDGALRSFISAQKQGSFIKSAYLYLSWMSFLDNDEAGYQSNVSKIATNGELVVDEDKQAQAFFLSRIKPNPVLLKARLLTDGGYLNKAHAVLINGSKEIKNSLELKEYSYRLARIYHKQGNLNKAEVYYKNTLEEFTFEKDYFQPNSALQLALIFEQKGNKEEAEKYFKKAMEFSGYSYKNSITQKAKAGLSRIKW